MRRVPLLIAFIALLALPATAAARRAPADASRAPADAAASTSAVRLIECDAGARSADVDGDMRLAGVPDATRMQMRFSVQVRAGKREWKRVPAPTLDTWVTAQKGRARYVYRKHVEGLQPGATYRVLVRFRWRDADGEVLKTVQKHSDACAVPEDRPNLVPKAIEVRAGLVPGRALYLVTVANKGRSAAPATSVAFDAGDAVLPDRPAPVLAAGEQTIVAFDGPSCAAGTELVAAVDATGLVEEASEADDVLQAPCPGA